MFEGTMDLIMNKMITLDMDHSKVIERYKKYNLDLKILSNRVSQLELKFIK